MSKLLQKYCDKVDRTLQAHELTGRVIDGNLDRQAGVVSLRAPVDDLVTLRHDLARALGVRGVRLFLVIEARASDQ